jgi:hypothetical protein
MSRRRLPRRGGHAQDRARAPMYVVGLGAGYQDWAMRLLARVSREWRRHSSFLARGILVKNLPILAYCAVFFCAMRLYRTVALPQTLQRRLRRSGNASGELADVPLGAKCARSNAGVLTVSDIGVIAKAGEASLSGTVPDTSQIALVGAAAAAAPSVKTVSNQLTVRIPGGH